ncbi:hypothetical protein ABLT31_09755 [Ammoniphilus sp. 3BR4]
MGESLGWLAYTFVSSLLCFFWLDWIMTITCFVSGLLMSIKAMIKEYAERDR